MFRRAMRPVVLVAALPAMAVLLGCEDSEVVCPDGATVTLAANPAQIVLVGGVQDVNIPVDIIATIRSEIGVPLPGQDVRFDTTSGVLTPTVGLPVTTDDFGNAHSILTLATVGPTITGTCGKATDTLTLTAASGLLSSIQLTPSSFTVNTCSDMPTFTATAFDPDSDPLENVSLEIFVENAGQNDVPNISFPNSPAVTNAMGQVTFTFNFSDSTDCNNKCGGGNTCLATLKVRNTFGQNVNSNTSLMTDGI